MLIQPINEKNLTHGTERKSERRERDKVHEGQVKVVKRHSTGPGSRKQVATLLPSTLQVTNEIEAESDGFRFPQECIEHKQLEFL
jgi:hypothetical protein